MHYAFAVWSIIFWNADEISGHAHKLGYGLFIMVLRVPGQDFGVHPVLVNHVGDQHHFP